MQREFIGNGGNVDRRAEVLSSDETVNEIITISVDLIAGIDLDQRVAARFGPTLPAGISWRALQLSCQDRFSAPSNSDSTDPDSDDILLELKIGLRLDEVADVQRKLLPANTRRQPGDDLRELP